MDGNEALEAARARDAALSPEEREERRKRMLANYAKAAEAEGPKARALEWRTRSMEYRAHVGIGLLRLAESIRQSTGQVYRRPPPLNIKTISESARRRTDAA
jgi:hypothetical protein